MCALFSLLTALPASLRFWTEARVLPGDGYTVRKRRVLGMFSLTATQHQLYYY